MRTANMPDRDEPASGNAERTAEMMGPAQPAPVLRPVGPDPTLGQDLHVMAMLQALGSTLRADARADALPEGAAPSARPGAAADRRTDVGILADAAAWADAKARVRARVMASLTDDPSSAGGSGARTALPGAPDSTPTDRLAKIPAGRATAAPPPPRTAIALNAISRRLTSRMAFVRAARTSAGPGPATRHGPDLVGPAQQRRHARPQRPVGRPSAVLPSVTRRISVIGATAFLAAIAVAAGGVLASRDTVPGDTLYSVKRAAEAADGMFTADDGSRARHDLHLAGTRLDEIERMAGGPTDPELLQAAIQDLDAAAVSGSRLALSDPAGDGTTGEGTDSRNAVGRPAAVDLAAWAAAQTMRLVTLRPTLPLSARPAVDDTLRLLDRVYRRAVAVAGRLGCARVTSDAADDLGPLPADEPCTAHPSSGPVVAAAQPSPAVAASAEVHPGSAPTVSPATKTEASTAPTGAHTTAPTTAKRKPTPEHGQMSTTAPGGTPDSGRPNADGAPDDASGRSARDDTGGSTGGGDAGTPTTSTAASGHVDPGSPPHAFTAVPRVPVG